MGMCRRGSGSRCQELHYLRRIRRLGKLLLRSAWQAWQEYLCKRLQLRTCMSSGIFCLQTHGSLFKFHPHVHALVLPGLARENLFHELRGCSATEVAVSFCSRFLNALQNQKILDGDMVERLMSWNHNSGFNVHAGKPINGADGEAIERQARYMSRAPLSVERIHYLADDYSVTVDGGKSHAGAKNWTVPEFFALLAAPPAATKARSSTTAFTAAVIAASVSVKTVKNESRGSLWRLCR